MGYKMNGFSNEVYTQKHSKLVLWFFPTCCLFFSPALLASSEDITKNDLVPIKKAFFLENKYKPYVEIGEAKYFNHPSNVAGAYDLFIPLYQPKDNQLLFSDLRIFDRSGSSFEVNAHLGYRILCPDTKQIFGVYGSFDRRKVDIDNLYSQLTFGAEYWNNKFFVGGNFYRPVGRQPNPNVEKAAAGADAELGYAFTEDFTGYAGGYYFHAIGADTVAGPKIRFTYNYSHPNGRILGIVDGISLEGGAEHNKPAGYRAYVGIKFRIGLTNFEKNSNVFGFERHMVELVKRDPDIRTVVVTETHVQQIVYSTKKEEVKQPTEAPKNNPPKESPKEPPKEDSNKGTQSGEPKVTKDEL
jgi:hypothetical protein